jgi:hypothetical protein
MSASESVEADYEDPGPLFSLLVDYNEQLHHGAGSDARHRPATGTSPTAWVRNLESALRFRLTPTPPIDADISNHGERENASPKDAEERADDGQRNDDPAASSSLFSGMDAAAGELQFTPPLSPIQAAEEGAQGGREEGKCGDAAAVSSNARSLQLNLRSDFNRREAAVISAANERK